MSLYHFVRIVVTGWAKLTGCTMTGREQIPAEGPAIIICNHTSMMDPVFLACTSKRQIHFMAKEEFFEKKVIGKLFSQVGAFPVARGESDMASLRTAMACLKNGDVLGIFPEGTRGQAGRLLPFKKGVALIAFKSKVPVIPIGMKRSHNFFPFWNRPRPSLAIGQPLTMPEQKTPDLLDAATAEFQTTVEALLDKME